MTLTEIANKHNCDKGTVAYEKHSYTLEYENYIPSTGVYNLLEIGIWHGDSLRMWNEYNPEAIIYGIDNDLGVHRYISSTPNIRVYIGDQNSPEDLMQIVKTAKKFKFIIDDGSHYANDIFNSFIILFPYLEKGGIYFIEDLHFGGAVGTIRRINDYIKEQGWTVSTKLLCNNKLLVLQNGNSDNNK